MHKKHALQSFYFARCFYDLVILDIYEDQYYCIPDFYDTNLKFIDKISKLKIIFSEKLSEQDIDKYIPIIINLKTKILNEYFTPKWNIKKSYRPGSTSIEIISSLIVIITSFFVYFFGIRSFLYLRFFLKNKEKKNGILKKYGKLEIINAINWAYRFDISGNQCLSNSVALHTALMLAGIPATAIIAIRSRPFRSHAWVICENQIINENINIEGSLVRIFEYK